MVTKACLAGVWQKGENSGSKIVLLYFTFTIAGTTPGPIMLGTIMDSACQTWQDLCGATGNCWIYQKTGMGVKLFIWWCCVKVVCIIFYFLAQYFYVPADNESDDDDAEEKQALADPVEVLECRESNI